MRSFSLLLPVLCAAVLLPLAAKADPITYDISFTASGETQASGAFTLTLDPSLIYQDATDGLTVDALSDGYAVPTSSTFDYSDGFLCIGGEAVDACGYGSYSPDYYLIIGDFPVAPTFKQFVAVQAVVDSGNNVGIPYNDLVGTVTVTQVAQTPELSSLALLGTGLLGIAGAVRRRPV